MNDTITLDMLTKVAGILVATKRIAITMPNQETLWDLLTAEVVYRFVNAVEDIAARHQVEVTTEGGQ